MCFLRGKVLCRLDQPKRKLASPHQSEVVVCFVLVQFGREFFLQEKQKMTAIETGGSSLIVRQCWQRASRNLTVRPA